MSETTNGGAVETPPEIGDTELADWMVEGVLHQPGGQIREPLAADQRRFDLALERGYVARKPGALLGRMPAAYHVTEAGMMFAVQNVTGAK